MQNPKSSWLSLIEPVALFPELLAPNSPLKIKLSFLKRRVKELSLLSHARSCPSALQAEAEGWPRIQG